MMLMCCRIILEDDDEDLDVEPVPRRPVLVISDSLKEGLQRGISDILPQTVAQSVYVLHAHFHNPLTPEVPSPPLLLSFLRVSALPECHVLLCYWF